MLPPAAPRITPGEKDGMTPGAGPATTPGTAPEATLSPPAPDPLP
jgi:hypothetical protein